MICESRGLDRVCQSSGSMYYNVADSVFPMLALQSAAAGGQVDSSPLTLPAIHGMAQDFQQYGLFNNGAGLLDSSNYVMKQQQQHQPQPQPQPQPRGLWCYGIQSDVAKEWSFLLNRNGMTATGSKLAAEAAVEGGAVVVRSQLCPWSSTNVGNTNGIAATDPMIFQRILDVALSAETRRPGGPDQGWCKYCCSLEKELTNSLEAKERWADENSWEDISFKQVDPYFESRTTPTTSLAEQTECRKRKHALDEWENDRSVVLLKLDELSMRATRAEQRVLELEQLLREHALVALDETCDDSDIVTSASQHDCFNEEQSEMLVCKMAGCNKAFKSSKTLRRHVLQKHSDNARFLVCNQPTVNGLMCRFETIHSGVLSYHRKHSLAHQRREDWHISCPFCQSKFARQHEMERHRRICKSRPRGVSAANNNNNNNNNNCNNSIGSVQSTTVSGTTLQSAEGLSMAGHQAMPAIPSNSFVMPDRGNNNNNNNHSQLFNVPNSNMESSITY